MFMTIVQVLIEASSPPSMTSDQRQLVCQTDMPTWIPAGQPGGGMHTPDNSSLQGSDQEAKIEIRPLGFFLLR